MNVLHKQILADIREHGPLPFIDFMETALYADDYGYYTSKRDIFGAGGDFVTAPELAGPGRISLFAACLANYLAERYPELVRQTLVEVGPGSGRLAVDLIQALQQLGVTPERYVLVERSRLLRLRQQALVTAAGLEQLVCWQSTPPESEWQGILLANELFDALPVERFRVHADHIARLVVDAGAGGRLIWRELEAPPALAKQVEAIRRRLDAEAVPAWPAPYTSEISPGTGDLLQALTGHLRRGLALFIDYGYLRHEYYHPQRHMGTLVSHASQHGHFDVLARPGEQDISAFVDFSALVDAARDCGLTVQSFGPLADFLLEAGIDRMLQDSRGDGDSRLLLERNAEFKQLMLPAEMGEKFKVLELTRR